MVVENDMIVIFHEGKIQVVQVEREFIFQTLPV